MLMIRFRLRHDSSKGLANFSFKITVNALGYILSLKIVTSLMSDESIIRHLVMLSVSAIFLFLSLQRFFQKSLEIIEQGIVGPEGHLMSRPEEVRSRS